MKKTSKGEKLKLPNRLKDAVELGWTNLRFEVFDELFLVGLAPFVLVDLHIGSGERLIDLQDERAR